jgi:peptidyl-prolyl cis-trans isomerase A (cyclophilin A)
MGNRVAAALLLVTVAACSKATGEKPQPAPEPEGNPMVQLETSVGAITVELDREHAPKSVENFLAYADAGFYDGTVFHRVIPGFMIQGGGFDPEMQQKQTRPPIENEATNGLKNTKGTLAMARTSDPNSATAQFFINLVDNAFLDHGSRDYGYAVFGRVVEGMEIVEKIAAVPTGQRGPHQNVPLEPVVIESVDRVDPQ